MHKNKGTAYEMRLKTSHFMRKQLLFLSDSQQRLGQTPRWFASLLPAWLPMIGP